MPENFANRYQTALAAGIMSGDPTGTVTSVTGVPAVPFRAIISAEGANTDEIVLVTGQAGTTLTWTRAVEAVAGVQAASAHGIGATFTAIVTAVGLASLTDVTSASPGDYVARIKLTADTEYRLRVGLNGASEAEILMGLGGVTVPDLRLRLTATHRLWMDDGAGGRAVLVLEDIYAANPPTVNAADTDFYVDTVAHRVGIGGATTGDFFTVGRRSVDAVSFEVTYLGFVFRGTQSVAGEESGIAGQTILTNVASYWDPVAEESVDKFGTLAFRAAESYVGKWIIEGPGNEALHVYDAGRADAHQWTLGPGFRIIDNDDWVAYPYPEYTPRAQLSYDALEFGPGGNVVIDVRGKRTAAKTIVWDDGAGGDVTVDVIGSLLENGAPVGGGGWAMVMKTADETVTANTVVQDDDTLQLALLANTKYHIRLRAYYTTPAAADFKYQVIGPAGPDLVFRHVVRGADSVVHLHSNAFSSGDTALTGAVGLGVVYEDIVVHTDAAGTFKFQWAQNASDAGNTIVRAGSYLEWRVI